MRVCVCGGAECVHVCVRWGWCEHAVGLVCACGGAGVSMRWGWCVRAVGLV